MMANLATNIYDINYLNPLIQLTKSNLKRATMLECTSNNDVQFSENNVRNRWRAQQCELRQVVRMSECLCCSVLWSVMCD